MLNKDYLFLAFFQHPLAILAIMFIISTQSHHLYLENQAIYLFVIPSLYILCRNCNILITCFLCGALPRPFECKRDSETFCLPYALSIQAFQRKKPQKTFQGLLPAFYPTPCNEACVYNRLVSLFGFCKRVFLNFLVGGKRNTQRSLS